jgi:riboflavin transporter FmnP
MKTYKLTAVAMLSCVAAILQVSNGIIGIPSGFGMTVDLVGVPIFLGFLLFGLDAAMYIALLTTLIITLVAPTSWIGAIMKFTATVPMFLVPSFYLLSVKKNFDLGKILINVFFALFISMMLFILSINANFVGQSVVTPSASTLYTVPRIDFLNFTETRVTVSDLLLGLLPVATIAVFSLIVLHFWGKYSSDTNPLIFSSADAMLIVAFLAILVRGIAMIISNYYFAGPLFWHTSPADLMNMFPWYVLFLWNAFQGLIEVALAWTLAFRFGFIERYMKW